MSDGGKMVMALAVVAMTCTSQAISPTSVNGPYREIVVRNIFSLQDEPPPPQPPERKKTPPNVKLIGVMMLANQPQVIIWTQEPGSPPKQPVTTVMKEGMRSGPVEVLGINLAGKTATVQIGEDRVVLNLEDKPVPGTVQPGVAVASPRMPINPGAPNAFRPNPAARPVGTQNMPIIPSIPSIPTAANPAGGSVNPMVNPNLNGGLPSRTLRTDAASAAPVSPEQQMIMMEYQRDEAAKAGSPIANLIPPTPLGKMMGVPPAGANTPQVPAPPSP